MLLPKRFHRLARTPHTERFLLSVPRPGGRAGGSRRGVLHVYAEQARAPYTTCQRLCVVYSWALPGSRERRVQPARWPSAPPGRAGKPRANGLSSHAASGAGERLQLEVESNPRTSVTHSSKWRRVGCSRPSLPRACCQALSMASARCCRCGSAPRFQNSRVLRIHA